MLPGGATAPMMVPAAPRPGRVPEPVPPPVRPRTPPRWPATKTSQEPLPARPRTPPRWSATRQGPRAADFLNLAERTSSPASFVHVESGRMPTKMPAQAKAEPFRMVSPESTPRLASAGQATGAKPEASDSASEGQSRTEGPSQGNSSGNSAQNGEESENNDDGNNAQSSPGGPSGTLTPRGPSAASEDSSLPAQQLQEPVEPPAADGEASDPIAALAAEALRLEAAAEHARMHLNVIHEIHKKMLGQNVTVEPRVLMSSLNRALLWGRQTTTSPAALRVLMPLSSLLQWLVMAEKHMTEYCAVRGQLLMPLDHAPVCYQIAFKGHGWYKGPARHAGTSDVPVTWLNGASPEGHERAELEFNPVEWQSDCFAVAFVMVECDIHYDSVSEKHSIHTISQGTAAKWAEKMRLISEALVTMKKFQFTAARQYPPQLPEDWGVIQNHLYMPIVCWLRPIKPENAAPKQKKNHPTASSSWQDSWQRSSRPRSSDEALFVNFWVRECRETSFLLGQCSVVSGVATVSPTASAVASASVGVPGNV